jgi:phosphatidylglycerophosphatase A
METAILSIASLAAVLGGWELVLILAVVMILVGARHLPLLSRGLGRGFEEFMRAINDDLHEHEESYRKKESGLVYEALTSENRTAEFVYSPQAESPSHFRAMILWLAQGFGIGRIPFAPGTFGSLVGLIWFAILVTTGNYWIYLAGTLAGLLLSVWVCGAAEKILKQTDPSSVVLDEIVAMPICFLPIVTQASRTAWPAVEWFFSGGPLLWTVVIFALFRFFDIAKPWPVRQSQRLPGGWGVTVDDVLAAAYVAIITLFFPI